jgi:hypothetical protein
MIPSDLRTMYRQGRLIPFIGAGASMAVEWEVGSRRRRGLSWSELVDEAIRLLEIKPPALLHARGNNLQILEYFKLVNHGPAKLSNWLYAEMRAPDQALHDSAIHHALANLVKCRVFYTTNYDDFIERALRLHGREVRPVAIEAHMGRRDNYIEVVKFHGDFNHPDSMVLTESDYERRLKLDDPMDLRLRADLLGSGVLFVGYSFSDPNVSYIFRLVNELFDRLPESRTGRRGYVIVADPSDFEYRLFEARNITVLPVSRARLQEDTVEILRQLET